MGRSVGVFVGAGVVESQAQVQMSGYSSVTYRQAWDSSNGPVVTPTLINVSSSESLRKDIRAPQVKPPAKVLQTASVHVSHPHRYEEDVGTGTGAATGAGVGFFEGTSVGEKVGVLVGSNVGEKVGDFVGSNVGDTVGFFVGKSVGTGVGIETGAVVGVAPQAQVQIVGNSSLIYWQA